MRTPASFASWPPSLDPGLWKPFGNADNSLSLAIRVGGRLNYPVASQLGRRTVAWHRSRWASHGTSAWLSHTCSLWGHVTKFIINAELIWLPWLTLSDFSLGCICLHGENDCTELKGYFPLQIHLGLSLRSYAPWHQNWTHGLWKTTNDIVGKKWCQLRFVFSFSFWTLTER